MVVLLGHVIGKTVQKIGRRAFGRLGSAVATFSIPCVRNYKSLRKLDFLYL